LNRLTSKVVFHSAVILILLGLFAVLIALTNPPAVSMATATLLIGVVMIAIASFDAPDERDCQQHSGGQEAQEAGGRSGEQELDERRRLAGL